MSATPAQLEWHVTWLLRRGYEPLTFTAAATRAQDRPGFAVTFDDGFASVRRLALPILERLDVPATVFTTTRFADDGGQARWEGLEPWSVGEHARELATMSWDDLAELQGHGWEIGSHTISHARLPTLDDAQLAAELAVSRTRCEQMLDVPCTAVAYPYGAVDPRTTAAAREAGYSAGAALVVAPVTTRNPLAVPRVGVGHRDRPWRFALKSAPAVLSLRARLGR